MFTFDHFEPGKCYGTSRFELSEKALADWHAVFPEDMEGTHMPPGMTGVVTAQAYHDIIKPRPSGNMHGAQRYEMHRLPLLGETLLTSVTCDSKEERKGRRFVHLGFETRTLDGALAFRGLFTSIVAA